MGTLRPADRGVLGEAQGVLMGKFVLIYVIFSGAGGSFGQNGSVYFDLPGACLSAKVDMAKRLGAKLEYAECFPTGVNPVGDKP